MTTTKHYNIILLSYHIQALSYPKTTQSIYFTKWLLHITYTLLTNNVDTRDPIGSKNIEIRTLKSVLSDEQCTIFKTGHK